MLPVAACGGGGSGSPPASSGNAPAESAKVTKKKASRIATDKYGGKGISVEPDHQKGTATWEVEVKNSRKGRIEVDVAKTTGKIVAFQKG